MPFQIVRSDITKMQADAIVNTANSRPVYAGGTDAAIYKAAGAKLLLAERQKIGKLKEGEAAITPAFRLDARYIIHTVEPVWKGGWQGETKKIRACYENSLRLAERHGCRSIALPLISTEIYKFPKNRALRTALAVINEFLLEHEMLVYLVVFDKQSFSLSGRLFEDIDSFIDENYAQVYKKANLSRKLFSKILCNPEYQPRKELSRMH